MFRVHVLLILVLAMIGCGGSPDTTDSFNGNQGKFYKCGTMSNPIDNCTVATQNFCSFKERSLSKKNSYSIADGWGSRGCNCVSQNASCPDGSDQYLYIR